MYTKGKWKVEKSDLTVRSNDFKNGTQMGDYKGVIIADLKPALGCGVTEKGDVDYQCIRFHALPETLANAHLIAQSPRMAEWIAKIAITQHGYAYQEDVDEAIDLLAEAEGK